MKILLSVFQHCLFNVSEDRETWSRTRLDVPLIGFKTLFNSGKCPSRQSTTTSILRSSLPTAPFRFVVGILIFVLLDFEKRFKIIITTCEQYCRLYFHSWLPVDRNADRLTHSLFSWLSRNTERIERSSVAQSLVSELRCAIISFYSLHSRSVQEMQLVSHGVELHLFWPMRFNYWYFGRSGIRADNFQLLFWIRKSCMAPYIT